MKNFILLTVIALTVVACGHSPKHIKDIKNVQTSALSSGSEERYLLVTDPASNLCGIAEINGSIILPPKYKDVVVCFNTIKSNDIFLVANPKGLCGAYNTSGKSIIKEEYDELTLSPEVSKTDTLVVFRTTLQKQRNYEYEVEADGEKKTIIDDEFDLLYGILSLDGKTLVPCKFRHVTYVGNKLFKVESPKDRNQHTYFGMYKDNNDVIPCEYTSLKISSSVNGAVACISSKDIKTWYAFDLTDGCRKTKLLYDNSAIGVSDHFIIISERNSQTRSFKDKVLDFKGNEIISAEEFNKIKEHDGFFVCNAGAYDILLDSSLNKIFGEKYYRISYNSGIFIVKDNNGHQGVIDKSGKWLIPCTYGKIVVSQGKIVGYQNSRKAYEIALP